MYPPLLKITRKHQWRRCLICIWRRWRQRLRDTLIKNTRITRSPAPIVCVKYDHVTFAAPTSHYIYTMTVFDYTCMKYLSVTFTRMHGYYRVYLIRYIIIIRKNVIQRDFFYGGNEGLGLFVYTIIYVHQWRSVFDCQCRIVVDNRVNF